MTLELNRRIVLRYLRDRAILYDPDRKRALTVNASGAAIYIQMRDRLPLRTTLDEITGGDRRKICEVEPFLAMLQGAGFLTGFSGESLPPLPATKTNAAETADRRCGIGSSMLGTFAGGDELETVTVAPERLRRGDVVVFSDASGRQTGHRIVGGKPGAWITMGDNNDLPDPKPLAPEGPIPLITGRRRDGRYAAIAGGAAGMRHFYRLRLQRQLRVFLRKVFVPVLNLGFWRKLPDHAAVFGETIQYSHRGRLIGWRIRGIPVYLRQSLRLRYKLPEV
ncbi:MAG: hypothetical protein MR051_08985 [Lentisphaeria bacterium]|nr:hypothetical protein [Lentisphaeria bacterium]